MRDKPTGDALSQEAETPVEKLRRWELYGGHWRVDSRTSNQLEIALLTCSGGEKPIDSSQLFPASSPTLEAEAAIRTTDLREASAHAPSAGRSLVVRPGPTARTSAARRLGAAHWLSAYYQTDAPGSLQ